MSLFMLVRNYYFIIQVGDSRVYLYREKRLHQLTVDASTTKLKNGRMKQYLNNYLGKSDELWFSCEMVRFCRRIFLLSVQMDFIIISVKTI